MKQRINKKYIFAGIITVLLCFLIAMIVATKISADKNNFRVKALLLYSSESESQSYKATYSQLQQSFIANLDVSLCDASKNPQNLEDYDILYLDESLTESDSMKEEIISYVEGGGNVFAPNAFLSYFEPEFFGAKEIVKIDIVPENMVYPGVAEDFLEFQGIIKDFETIYKLYTDYDKLKDADYGYGIIPDTAKSIADFSGISLYGINGYGEGTVLYTNPLLPNAFTINDFSLQKTNDNQLAFANSTATANQLILGEYASIVSKAKYGYSVKHILGSFSSPSIAWQLHYEEITAIENLSAITFGDMCKEYNAIPSFTLIRNTYKWLSKYETVTYLLSENGNYKMDFNENAYSSGTHISENGKYLSLTEVSGVGSYFEDDTNFMQMAYPDVLDFNNDNVADLVVGSSDGYFYLFEGESFADKWKVLQRRLLTDNEQNPIKVSAYSAPALADLDNDGVLDLISGQEKGDILFFKGLGNMTFEKGKTLISTIDMKRTMPSVGDVNNDGRLDIAVGSVDGGIDIYNQSEDGSFAYTGSIVSENDIFMAPCLYDYNNDGFSDLVYGNFYGNIKKMKNNQDNSFVFEGFYDTNEMNFKGDYHIKLGNNCVPRFFDINADGSPDLIAGELEYGLAIPIDSPDFALSGHLGQQIEYIKENRFYLGTHFYTNRYASKAREAEELKLHKKAFEKYGINYDNTGVNMHTWFVSNHSPEQTMRSAYDAGFLWSSGAQWAESNATPQTCAENMLASPFFMDYDKRDFMITNAGIHGYPMYGDYAYLSAKYDLPVSQYYHCDMVYKDEAGGRAMIEQLVNYQKQNYYNFVREDQFMKSAAAAYNSKLIQKDRNNNIVELSATALKKNFGLYDEAFANCTGVKIDFAERIDIENVMVDADVWRYDKNKNDLYVALNSKVKIAFDTKTEKKGFSYIISQESHILGVNIPAEIEQKGKKVTVKFEDDGMMQARVLGEITEYSPDWTMSFDNGVTTFTKFGPESDLTFTLK